MVLEEAIKMSGQYLLKQLSRYNPGTWADIIYRNAKLMPNREAFVFGNILLVETGDIITIIIVDIIIIFISYRR